MNKKLPKVFVNQIDKKLTNNDKVYYSSKEKEVEIEVSESRLNTLKTGGIDFQKMDVQQKIWRIFNSPTYVYKANLDIKTKSGNITKQIIGKNRTHLISIDNEQILINDILDIDFSK